MALPKTKSVLSNIERTMILPIWGLRYGGSSRVKEVKTPFNIVFESSLDTAKVIPTPSSITKVSSNADKIDSNPPAEVPIKNMVNMAIRVGNLPLQGTKLLVNIPISRSLGESIILHPTTPAALHPNPMHMVG